MSRKMINYKNRLYSKEELIEFAELIRDVTLQNDALDEDMKDLFVSVETNVDAFIKDKPHVDDAVVELMKLAEFFSKEFPNIITTPDSYLVDEVIKLLKDFKKYSGISGAKVLDRMEVIRIVSTAFMINNFDTTSDLMGYIINNICSLAIPEKGNLKGTSNGIKFLSVEFDELKEIK